MRSSADHPDPLLRVGLFFPESWPCAEAWTVDPDDWAPVVEVADVHDDAAGPIELGWRAWWDLDEENSGDRDSRVTVLRYR